MSVYTVTIPHWEDRYKLSERTQPKYWLWKDSKSLPLKHQKELKLLRNFKKNNIDKLTNGF